MTARALAVAGLALLLAGCAATPRPSTGMEPPGDESAVPPGFTAEVVLRGLERPTALRFGPTGRAWVAEQSGVVKVFDRLSDGAPVLRADLSDHVFGRNNRGLLGLAPDPVDDAAAFVLYTYPAPPSAADPVWNDDATNCPGGATRTCVSTGVLSRIAFGPDGVATETVLVRAWCHHHGSHAPNDLAFGPDGALYAAAGEGSVPELEADDGTWLPPDERCHDGAFASRANPRERTPGQWTGAIVRFAASDLAAVARHEETSDWLAGRVTVVAYGLRNPFRMAFRPGTPELWIGDPGWETWEEINVVEDATDSEVDDFGWPCREGHDRQANFASDARCAALDRDPKLAVEPWFVLRWGEQVNTSDRCVTEASSITAIALGPSAWPEPYRGALTFADLSRGCAYLAPVGGDGRPDPAGVRLFWSRAGSTVDLQAGPDGALYAVGFTEGVVTRLGWAGP